MKKKFEIELDLLRVEKQNLESDKLGIFIVSDSNDFSYIINPFLVQNEENFQYFTFIGKLISKALLDNITINICFNKLIYKMILQEKIEFNDFHKVMRNFFD